jgi:hypothetical protein
LRQQRASKDAPEGAGEAAGLERDVNGRQVVGAQAGCRLKKLNSWLQARGMEVPFQAEIGEATVGSVAVGDTKDSVGLWLQPGQDLFLTAETGY